MSGCSGITLNRSIILSLSLLLLLSSPLVKSDAECNSADKAALLAIYANFENPSYLSKTWIPSTDCCGWNGVSCNATTGRVNNLFIQTDRQVTGTISSAVGDLPELLSLGLTKLPNLVGTIPYSITKLQKLVFLELSHNSLSGSVPPFLSELSTLTFLDLSHNKFSGSIPPSLSKLGNVLGALVLSHNKLTGSIPDSFGSFPDQPGTLFLDHNRLSGPIPKSLGKPQWPFIHLSHNRLIGDASFLFGSWKATLQINLQWNMLSFDLTNISFPTNLTILELNNNMIYGSIPAQINEVTGFGLTDFNVSYNMLCGEIPAGSVTAMFNQSAYFNNKCLCGAPLPACK